MYCRLLGIFKSFGAAVFDQGAANLFSMGREFFTDFNLIKLCLQIKAFLF